MKSRNLGTKWIVGIDEAGRGPLAGPLAIGFVVMSRDLYTKYINKTDSLPSGKDSKKLSSIKRLKYFQSIKNDTSIRHLVILVNEKNIDSRGLSISIQNAIKKGLKDLQIPVKGSKILLDGGLKAPPYYEQTTIIKGDEKERIIGLASICAKVTRDMKMERVAKRYPEYGFEKHKGYGTKEHRQIIKRLGLAPIHRKTFCKNLIASMK